MGAIVDISGFQLFSQGAPGAAHVAAHRMLDLGQHAEGRRQLGAWLSVNDGAGSDWVHLQWHMLVFELAVGAWDDAHARFLQHVLPAASRGNEAATDAPAALWRLTLAVPGAVELPWGEVRQSALGRMGKPRDPYVELHDLLALAGAGDVDALDAWLRQHRPHNEDVRTLAHFARAFRAYAVGDYARSARAFAAALPGVAKLGGSRAQNEMFVDIYRSAVRRSGREERRVVQLAQAVGA